MLSLQKFGQIAVATAALFAFTGASQAATMTYTNVETTPKMQLIVDDAAAAGAMRFSLSTLIGDADYLALAFNYGGSGSLTQSALSLFSATRLDGNAITPALQLFGDGGDKVTDCGTGCNFSGGDSASFFDYIVRIGVVGSSGDNYVASVVFDIATLGLLTDFTQFAVRAQTTSNEQGSIKTDLAPIPVPAAGFLLLGALAGLSLLRRRKTV